jgi:hypothetical protein
MSQLAFSDALQRDLVFNGKGALANGKNFLEVVVDDPLGHDAAPDYEGAISSLLGFAPDIVIFAMGYSLVGRVLIPGDERWPTANAHPIYVGYEPMSQELFPFIGKSEERRRRFFGLTNVSTTPNNARLVAHFNETFRDKVTRTASPNGSYDAFYMLAYASLATSTDPVTGPSLSRAFSRLEPPGAALDIGPLTILDGYGRLARGENIDLDGTLGHMDFDPRTGESPVDLAILCVDVDRQGVASSVVESGLVFDAREGVMKGKFVCP